MRPERISQFLNYLIYEMQCKLQKNFGPFELNFIRIYEKTLKSIMWKYSENSAYVTLFLKKTTRNFGKNLA